MTEQRIKEVVEYFNVCKTCGEEFIVTTHHFDQKACDSCMAKASSDRAKKQLRHLIGATIINMEPESCCGTSYPSDLECVEVKLRNGECIRFTSQGEEGGSHIVWEVFRA